MYYFFNGVSNDILTTLDIDQSQHIIPILSSSINEIEQTKLSRKDTIFDHFLFLIFKLF